MPLTIQNGISSVSADGDFLKVASKRGNGRGRGARGGRNNATSPTKFLNNVQHNCRICQKDAGEDWISCDRCSCMMHVECSSIENTEFDYLRNHADTKLLFYCSICTEELKGNEGQDTKISQLNAKIDSLTETVNIVLGIMKKSEENKKIYNEEKLKKDEKVQETVDQVKEVLKEQQVKSKETAAQVKEVLKEHKEKDDKEKNLMIFNLPESDSKLDPKKAKEEDISKTMDILTFLDGDVPNDVIIVRIGRRNEEVTARPRPIKITLPDIEIKQNLMSNASDLKDYTKYPKIGICHDKTRKEINEDKALRALLAKKRAEQPEFDWTIFNKEVVKRSDVPKLRQLRRQQDQEEETEVKTVETADA